MSPQTTQRISFKDWKAKGENLFGTDTKKWRFICPVCKFEQSTQDYLDAGAPKNTVGFSCVGRWRADASDAMSSKHDGSKPCNYVGGGLFRLNPVHVVASGENAEGVREEVVTEMFAFAESKDAAT